MMKKKRGQKNKGQENVKSWKDAIAESDIGVIHQQEEAIRKNATEALTLAMSNGTEAVMGCIIDVLRTATETYLSSSYGDEYDGRAAVLHCVYSAFKKFLYALPDYIKETQSIEAASDSAVYMIEYVFDTELVYYTGKNIHGLNEMFYNARENSRQGNSFPIRILIKMALYHRIAMHLRRRDKDRVLAFSQDMHAYINSFYKSVDKKVFTPLALLSRPENQPLFSDELIQVYAILEAKLGSLALSVRFLIFDQSSQDHTQSEKNRMRLFGLIEQAYRLLNHTDLDKDEREEWDKVLVLIGAKAVDNNAQSSAVLSSSSTQSSTNQTTQTVIPSTSSTDIMTAASSSSALANNDAELKALREQCQHLASKVSTLEATDKILQDRVKGLEQQLALIASSSAKETTKAKKSRSRVDKPRANGVVATSGSSTLFASSSTKGKDASPQRYNTKNTDELLVELSNFPDLPKMEELVRNRVPILEN